MLDIKTCNNLLGEIIELNTVWKGNRIVFHNALVLGVYTPLGSPEKTGLLILSFDQKTDSTFHLEGTPHTQYEDLQSIIERQSSSFDFQILGWKKIISNLKNPKNHFCWLPTELINYFKVNSLAATLISINNELNGL